MANSVELIGSYGGDTTHALSAWTSTDRELTPEKEARIDKLLKFLADEKHYSPFEKSSLHFLVECDTASHIHLLKHRIAVSINGESARYRQIDTRHYVPEDWPEGWQQQLDLFADQAERRYEQAIEELEPLLGRKRAKESARFFLPYANQLKLDVMFNFKSFMHFQGLRNKPDAQKEIAEIACEMLELVWKTGDFDDSLRAFGY